MKAMATHPIMANSTRPDRRFGANAAAVIITPKPRQAPNNSFGDGRPRTLRHRSSDFPWINDYIFASEELAEHVIASEVIENPELLSLSDHNPVTVVFGL